jgi:hypothetical protein
MESINSSARQPLLAGAATTSLALDGPVAVVLARRVRGLAIAFLICSVIAIIGAGLLAWGAVPLIFLLAIGLVVLVTSACIGYCGITGARGHGKCACGVMYLTVFFGIQVAATVVELAAFGLLAVAPVVMGYEYLTSLYTLLQTLAMLIFVPLSIAAAIYSKKLMDLRRWQRDRLIVWSRASTLARLSWPYYPGPPGVAFQPAQPFYPGPSGVASQPPPPPAQDDAQGSTSVRGRGVVMRGFKVK